MVSYLKQYAILFRKAGVDLKAAQILYSNFMNEDNELDPEIVFFHLHQAAEKLIKALLSYKNVNYPKIHDLAELINIVESNQIVIMPDKEKIINLGDYAVEVRYSVLHDDFEDAGQYIRLI